MKFIAAILCGILSGFGIGGGTLLIITMTSFLGISQTAAQGINLLYFIPTAGASLFGHIKNKMINFEVFLWTAIPGTVATLVSALVFGKLDKGISKKIFGGFLLIIGVSELFRKSKK